MYPLIPKVSPCIKTEFGAILFPNINVERNENSGKFFMYSSDHKMLRKIILIMFYDNLRNELRRRI